MKKLIAVLVVFALVTGMAFAQLSVGGQVFATWFPLAGGYDGSQNNREGENGVVDRPGTWLGWKDPGYLGQETDLRFRINFGATNEDGTFGASWQLRRDNEFGFFDGFAYNGVARIWWKPADAFTISLGEIWGGIGFGTGMHTTNGEILPIMAWGQTWGWHRNRVFKGYGWSVDKGAHLELTPIDNLKVLVTVPYDGRFWDWSSTKDHKASETYLNTAIGLRYGIDGFGNVVLVYDGGTMTFNSAPSYSSYGGKGSGPYDPAYATAIVNISAISGLGLSLGFDMPMPITKGRASSGFTKETIAGIDVKFQEAYGVDLRFSFSALDAFNLSGGVAYTFGGFFQNVAADTKEKYPTRLGVTLNPNFDVGFVKVGVVGEFNLNGKKYNVNDDEVALSNLAINVMPYVQKNLAGGARLYAGFQLHSVPFHKEGSTAVPQEWENKIQWTIPLAVSWDF